VASDRSLSACALRQAAALVAQRLADFAPNVVIDYLDDAVLASVAEDDLTAVQAVAQGDTELRAMLETAPGTRGRARLTIMTGGITLHPVGVPTQLTLTPDTAVPGGTIQVGIIVGTESEDWTVRLELRPGGIALGAWTADSCGSITASAALPAGLTPGNYTAAAVSADGSDLASAPLTVSETGSQPILRLPDIAVTPKEVKAGGTVQIGLTKLHPSTSVVVVLRPAGTELATWTADQNGAINSSVTLPAGLAAGDYDLAFVQRQETLPHYDLGAVAIKVTATGSSAVPRSSTDLPQTGLGNGPAMAVLAVSAVLLGAAGVGVAGGRPRGAPANM
jgi:hypothetical protein